MLIPEVLREAYNRKQELCGLTSVSWGSEVGGGGGPAETGNCNGLLCAKTSKGKVRQG